MRVFGLVLALAVLAMPTFGSGSAAAGAVEEQADGSTVWQAGVDGIEVEWKSRRLNQAHFIESQYSDRVWRP